MLKIRSKRCWRECKSWSDLLGSEKISGSDRGISRCSRSRTLQLDCALQPRHCTDSCWSAREEEGQKVIQRFQEFRTAEVAQRLGNNYLEHQVVTQTLLLRRALSQGLVDRQTPDVQFQGRDCAWRANGRAVARLRIHCSNGDSGAVVLFTITTATAILICLSFRAPRSASIRKRSGKVHGCHRAIRATWQRRRVQRRYALARWLATSATTAKPDLFIPALSSECALSCDGNGKFSDVTGESKAARLPVPFEDRLRFVDYDHDGDASTCSSLVIPDPAEALKTPANVRKPKANCRRPRISS